MNAQQLKEMTARAALDYIESNQILGVGTGSTVDCLIKLLPTVREKITGVVSSSERSSAQLIALGFPIVELSNIEGFSLYIDGADEINSDLAMIKGGGAALTREKIVAAHAERFICIADASKKVEILGKFPLPIEVIPMAAHFVMRALAPLGGSAKIRSDVVTDNGNWIIDLFGLNITNPIGLEEKINQITGVVTNGIFAKRPADLLLLSSQTGVNVFTRPQIL